MLYYEMFILTYNKQGSEWYLLFLTVIQVFNFLDSSLVFVLGIDKAKPNQNQTKQNPLTIDADLGRNATEY